MKPMNFPGRKNARRIRARDRLLDNVPKKPKAGKLTFDPKSSILRKLGISTEKQVDDYNRAQQEEANAKHKIALKAHRASLKKLEGLIIPEERARNIRTKKDRSARGRLTR